MFLICVRFGKQIAINLITGTCKQEVASMAAQTHSENKNHTENFKDNSFEKNSKKQSFNVLAGDNTQFKVENKIRPSWLKESFNVRPAAEGFAIYRNRAFQVLQNKLQR